MGQGVECLDLSKYRYFQMEPASLYDLYDHFLKFRPELRAKLDMFQIPTLSLSENLIMNLAYAVAAARLHYFRVSGSIPASLEGQADYWKEHWNTKIGKGSRDQYITHYNHYI